MSAIREIIEELIEFEHTLLLHQESGLQAGVMYNSNIWQYRMKGTQNPGHELAIKVGLVFRRRSDDN